MIEVAGIIFQKPMLEVGTKVKFYNEKQRYTVRASNVAYTIVTKPFNVQKTVLYSIIDFYENKRAPEDLVFGMGAETDKEIADMLERLTNGESGLSRRHERTLDIESITTPNGKTYHSRDIS